MVCELTFLAFRTEVRGPLRYQQAANRRPAGEARLPGALVNPVAELKKTLAALGVHVIRDGRTARRDGLRQYRSDGIEQPSWPLPAQARSHRQRVNSGTKERFIVWFNSSALMRVL